MEALLFALNESAKVLGLSLDSETFRAALAIGSEALDNGFDAETAIEFARRVLLEATPSVHAA